MKKTYINPQMVVVKVEMQQMLAASKNASIDSLTTQSDDVALGRDDEYDW